MQGGIYLAILNVWVRKAAGGNLALPAGRDFTVTYETLFIVYQRLTLNETFL
jgi:hypothetical protein